MHDDQEWNMNIYIYTHVYIYILYIYIHFDHIEVRFTQALTSLAEFWGCTVKLELNHLRIVWIVECGLQLWPANFNLIGPLSVTGYPEVSREDWTTGIMVPHCSNPSHERNLQPSTMESPWYLQVMKEFGWSPILCDCVLQSLKARVRLEGNCLGCNQFYLVRWPFSIVVDLSRVNRCLKCGTVLPWDILGLCNDSWTGPTPDPKL